MKLSLIAIAVLSFASSAFAEEKVTLSGVHNCCKKCADGINKAVAAAPGVTATIEKSTVTLSGATSADLQKATDSLVAAGYTGTSDNAAVKVAPAVGPDEKVASLTVSGTHLCCDKCVKAAEKAIQATAGAKSHDAKKGSTSFKVEGDFNGKELMASLGKAGFAGKASK